MTSIERQCQLILHTESTDEKESELLAQLEAKDDGQKALVMRKIIGRILNGEQMPKSLMAVIKHAMPSQDHLVKKLVLIYWEVIERRRPDGKVPDEMILVCQTLKNNLEHPNEYVRGSTLRLLTKMKEREIVEPLVPAIVENLKHRHAYVRKNAILALYAIYESTPDLCPDAPQHVARLLQSEYNPIAKRNGLVFLLHCDPESAVAYLNSILTSVSNQGEPVILVLLDVVKKACQLNPALKAHYVKCVHEMLDSYDAVTFEAANTLIALSSAPSAVRAAIGAYCRLLASDSDNNMRLVVLGRLIALRTKHSTILREFIVDILGALQTPNIEIRRRALGLAMMLVSPTSVDEVVSKLRKELEGTAASSTTNGNDSYRRLLVDALRRCAVRFPSVVSAVMAPLVGYLKEENSPAALDVVHFAREILEEYPTLRNVLIDKLLLAFDTIRSPDVFRGALWILGEYGADNEDMALRCLTTIRSAVGQLPLSSAIPQPTPPLSPIASSEPSSPSASSSTNVSSTPSSSSSSSSSTSSSTSTTPKASSLVMSDGTYSSQAAATLVSSSSSTGASSSSSPSSKASLRSFLLAPNMFLASSLAVAVTKLILSIRTRVLSRSTSLSSASYNEDVARALLLCSSLLQLPTIASAIAAANAATGNGNPTNGIPGTSSTLGTSLAGTNNTTATQTVDGDAAERIGACLRLLLTPTADNKAFAGSRKAFRSALLDHRSRQTSIDANALSTGNAFSSDNKGSASATAMANQLAHADEKKDVVVQADDALAFRALRSGKTDDDVDVTSAGTQGALDTTAENDLQVAISGKSKASLLDLSKLKRTFQLTGFGDPVYVEASVEVFEYDLAVTVMAVNQTNQVLHNLSLELNTSPDLKVVDRGGVANVPPHGTHHFNCLVKVTSTESGVIFGNIVYDNASGADNTIIVLSTIHIDIIDYIVPATCSDALFRSMWSVFEWENKVVVSTDITELKDYLAHLVAITNMRCLTPQVALGGGSSTGGNNFLAAILYAQSIFGEDALMNVSIEKTSTGRLSGFVRIRAKTQGIALGLGDKISAKQKQLDTSLLTQEGKV